MKGPGVAGALLCEVSGLDCLRSSPVSGQSSFGACFIWLDCFSSDSHFYTVSFSHSFCSIPSHAIFVLFRCIFVSSIDFSYSLVKS